MNQVAARTNPAPIELDGIDQAIIGLLRRDGRLPYRAIALFVELGQAVLGGGVADLGQGQPDVPGLFRITGAHGVETFLEGLRPGRRRSHEERDSQKRGQTTLV